MAGRPRHIEGPRSLSASNKPTSREPRAGERLPREQQPWKASASRNNSLPESRLAGNSPNFWFTTNMVQSRKVTEPPNIVVYLRPRDASSWHHLHKKRPACGSRRRDGHFCWLKWTKWNTKAKSANDCRLRSGRSWSDSVPRPYSFLGTCSTSPTKYPTSRVTRPSRIHRFFGRRPRAIQKTDGTFLGPYPPFSGYGKGRDPFLGSTFPGKDMKSGISRRHHPFRLVFGWLRMARLPAA